MWILECDGDLLQNKKIWLKPGHQYLFGRTKIDTGPGDRSYAITHKSVSRKHLVLAVSPLKPGEGSEIYTKSTLRITDESKLGTTLDGEKIIKDSKILSKNEHHITLGSYDQEFRISWNPVVISFSAPDKPKLGVDPIALNRARFEQFDIKIIASYIISDTTHVVSTKRNTPKGLQALINGKYVVTEDFLLALERAASSAGLAEDGTTPLASPLEGDFHASWPDAMEYLPPAGREPVQRSSEFFAPSADRISMFEGYTFIFADDNQFENLQPVVTNGGAKAIKFELQLGETTVEDFVKFAKTVADKKGLGNFGDNSQGKGVVVVRFRGKGETEAWALQFLRDLDLQLEQRSIEQNEFLDAILTKNAASLRKPLLDEETQGIRAPPSTAVTTRAADTQRASPSREGPMSTPADAEEDEEAPRRPPTSKARTRRTVTTSRFTGFDDFDPSQLSKSHRREADSPSEEEEEDEEAEASRPQTQSGMDIDSQSLFVSASQDQDTQQMSRKRKASLEEDTTGADMDAMLPAAAAMKKRRLEDEAAGRTTSFREREVDVEKSQAVNKKGGRKAAPRPEIDVRSVAREHAETVDAQRNKSQIQGAGDDLHIDESEIAQLRNLAIVEEMEIKPRVRFARHNSEDLPERWDDLWNGRKNFKKFRKHVRGEAGSAPAPNNRARKVIVTLEEVRRKDYGIGDDYWLEPASSSKTKGGKKARTSQSQNTSQSQRQPLGGDDEQSELVPEEIAGQPREGPVAEALRQINGQERVVGAAAKGKRPAPGAAKAGPPAKRQRAAAGVGRVAPARVDEEGSSDDGLKFRFRRGK